MRFHDWLTTGINNLHTSAIYQWKLCQNYMTLMNFLKVSFQLHLILTSNIKVNNLS